MKEVYYVTQSQKFKMLFTINVLALSTLFNFGLLRLLLGYQRNKPIEYLAIAIIVLIAVAIVFIQRLNFRLIANAVLDLYRLENNPTVDINNWQWKYYIYGEKIFDKSFLPLFKEVTGGNNVSKSWSSRATGDSGGDSGGCSGCGGCGGD